MTMDTSLQPRPPFRHHHHSLSSTNNKAPTATTTSRVQQQGNMMLSSLPSRDQRAVHGNDDNLTMSLLLLSDKPLALSDATRSAPFLSTGQKRDWIPPHGEQHTPCHAMEATGPNSSSNADIMDSDEALVVMTCMTPSCMPTTEDRGLGPPPLHQFDTKDDALYRTISNPPSERLLLPHL